ncbi:hypothetical protein PGB90_008981 [Kerria lacca]
MIAYTDGAVSYRVCGVRTYHFARRKKKETILLHAQSSGYSKTFLTNLKKKFYKRY